MDWIYWTPLAAACLHITEEFLLPGGFADWDRRYRPAIAASITTRFHVIINGLLLLLCYDVGVLRGTQSGVILWLTLTALQFSNAVWHLNGARKTRSYSPGMVTGLFLYIPLAIYGYVHFLRNGQASVLIAVFAFAFGVSYPLLSSFMHRRRARRAQAQG